MTITVNDRQTLFDIALLALGGVAGVFDLARRNGLSVTAAFPKPGKKTEAANLCDGKKLTYEMEDVVSPNVRRAYALQDIRPATDIPYADYMELLYQTGTKRPPVAQRYDYITTDEFVNIDKLTEVLGELSTGKQPAKAQSAQNLSRLFSNPFDETFA